MNCPMKYRIHTPSLRKSWLLAAALLFVAYARLNAEDVDTVVIQNVDVVIIQAAPAVALPAQAPAPVVAPIKEAKPANKIAKPKETSRLSLLNRPIVYPTIYPNPLAFNMTWVAMTNKTFAEARSLAIRQRLLAQRAALVRRPIPNAAAQNAIQQQLRKVLEPMLKTELSFAARATDLKGDDRKKLAADGKAWFEKFLVEFVQKQDPNQQQMLLQNMQGVWFGNQQQKTESPRDAIRVGIAKLVKDTLPKEKAVAYADECHKREEFARQVSVDNLVERIDEKVKLSPDQWKKIAKSLNDHWDKGRDPQLEAFAINGSMWPGAPDQWVLPELSPSQQAVLKRVNAMSGQMFINGGMFGQMFGGQAEVFDDMDIDVPNVEVDQPAAAAVPESAEE
jgi:hypothetical protein